jgi:tetratricopeptide (TPR) repeat protein
MLSRRRPVVRGSVVPKNAAEGVCCCSQLTGTGKLAVASDNPTANSITHEMVRKNTELLQGVQGDLEVFKNADFGLKLDQVLKGQQEMKVMLAASRQLAGAQQAGLSAGVGSTMASPDVAPINELNKKRFDRARAELDGGNVVYAQRDFEGLIGDLRSSSTDKELLFRALSNLGICCLRRGNRHEAVGFWEEAFLLKPDLIKAKTNRALGFTFEKNYEAAQAILDGVFVQEPSSWDAIAIQSVLHAEQQHHDKAARFLRAHPVERAEYYVMLAQQLVHLKQYEEALSLSIRALILEPKSCVGMAVKASALANPIIFRDSDSGSPYFTLSNSGRENLKEAIRLLEKAVSDFKARGETVDLGAHLTNLSAYYAAIGDFSASAAVAQEAVAASDGEDGALCNLFYAQMQLDDYKEAIGTATALCSRGNLQKGIVRLLDALVRDRSFARAVSEFNRAVQKEPDINNQLYPCCLMARALFGLPNTDEALSHVDALIVKFPGDPLPFLQKAEFKEQLGHREDARSNYEKAEALAQGESEILVRQQVGLFLFRTGSWDAAYSRIFPKEVDPLYSPFLKEGLVCLYELGRFKDCLDLARRAIDKDGYHEMTYATAAHCYIHFRQLPEAISLFKDLVARGNNLHHWVALAQLQFRADNVAEAERLLRRARAVFPDRGALPQGSLARVLHKSQFEIWGYLTSTEGQAVYVADGSAEEQKNSSQLVKDLKEITLDVTCLFTLQNLGLLAILPKLFDTIHVPVAVFEAIKMESEQLGSAIPAGPTLTLEGGQITVREVSPEVRSEDAAFIASILNFLKTLQSPEGISEIIGETGAAKKWLPLLSPSCIDPILIASGHGCPLAVDDLCLQKLVAKEFEVPCLSIQYLLGAALHRGFLTREQYDSATITLMGRGYTFVSDSAETAIAELNARDYEITPLASTLLSRLSDPRLFAAGATRVLVEVVAHVWVQQPERAKRLRAMKACASNFADERVIRSVLALFCTQLLIKFQNQPSVYFGIALQMFRDSALSLPQRRACLRLAMSAARVARSEFGKSGAWPANQCQDWRTQYAAARELLIVLIKAEGPAE